MKSIKFIILSLLVLSGYSFSETFVSVKDQAIYLLNAEQSKADPTYPDVQLRAAELVQDGFFKTNETDAVLLSGSCGFAGCDSTYLVTTAYSTRGANTQTKVLAALIGYTSYNKKVVITKVLTQEQIRALFSE